MVLTVHAALRVRARSAAPTAIFYEEDGTEVERVNLSKFKYDEIHELFESKGFKKKPKPATANVGAAAFDEKRKMDANGLAKHDRPGRRASEPKRSDLEVEEVLTKLEVPEKPRALDGREL